MPVGVEAQTTGLGGLAAQAPADLYFGAALTAANGSQIPLIGSPDRGGVTLAYTMDNPLSTSDALTFGEGVNSSGTAVTQPVAHQNPSWSSVLDFHNSPAPWVLLMILLLYGWLHVSVRAGRRGDLALS